MKTLLNPRAMALLLVTFATCSLLYQFATAAQQYATSRATSPTTQEHTLAPMQMDPAWIKAGKPVFHSLEFSRASDHSSRSGIFECTGPTTFEWHYGLDETIYILEGQVELEYLGKRFVAYPGQSVHFKAGTVAVWHVANRIKKAWVLYQPGKFRQWYERLLG